MPIGFGLAGSHANHLLSDTPEEWMSSYEASIARRGAKGPVPEPHETKHEDLDALKGILERRDRALDTLRTKLAEYDPELVILIGGDQNKEMFDESNCPNILIYTGEEDAWGYNLKRFQKPSEETLVRYKSDPETARRLVNKLVTEEGFDVAFSGVQHALGTPGQGIAHALVRPLAALMPRSDIPTVLVYVSSYDFPAPSAQRCYDLGRALARQLKDDPRRIAIGGSGGLSHDPFGPRAGFVDLPMDHWFMDQLTEGKGGVTRMYHFDSMTMRGGTGESRAWIVVAGAMEEMGGHAEIAEFIPSYTAITGLCWAYWPSPSVAATAT